jgi:GH43 family beta-xylosidase
MAETADRERMTVFNPLLPEGPDPWMVFHDGYYYFTCTSGNQIKIRRARSLADLGGGRGDRVVWEDNTPGRDKQMWAPEFDWLDGPNGRRWYLYYCASDGWHLNHRCHVLESQGDSPLGPYVYKGKLKTDPDDKYYAIDPGLLVTSDKQRMHFLWAGHPGHVIYISDMENPWTTRGKRVHLPAEGFGCAEVREGPVTLVRNGKVFLIYSICDTGKPDYKLGMLVADEKSDLLRPESWEQYPEPVFTRCDEHGVYGPGHNGFFRSPDGTEDWIIYHAKSTPSYTYRTRSPRAQKFTWRPDGTPDFGKPLALSAVIPVPAGDPGAMTGGRVARPTTQQRRD